MSSGSAAPAKKAQISGLDGPHNTIAAPRRMTKYPKPEDVERHAQKAGDKEPAVQKKSSGGGGEKTKGDKKCVIV